MSTPGFRTSASVRTSAIVATVVLLVAGCVLMLIQWIDIRREFLADAEAQARVVASGSAAAVMFRDSAGARETLAPLVSVPAVRQADIVARDGEVIARYPDGVDAAARPCGYDCARVSAPVLFRDQPVGTVRLQISMKRAHGRLGSLAIAFCIASAVAYALALPLMRGMRERVRRAEAQLHHLAHNDPITGLLNRNAFNAQLEHARTRNRRLALVQLDLDRFKDVNDKLGHQGGDALLRQVGHRIADALPAGARLFRLGGDEFAVLLAGDDAAARVGGVADAVLDRFVVPFTVDGLSLRITASAGISRWPEDAARLEELAANADIAMYCAKREGRNRAVRFEPRLRQAQLARIGVREALGQAVAAGQLALHYQPQVCAESGRLLGAEALLRWTHPALGVVPPSTFIPIAEEGPLILELGRWVIGEACRQIAAWHAQGRGHVRLAVNLSVRQTREDALPGFIDEVLRSTGVPAHCLELEVTESVLMEDADVAVAQLARLRARGLHMAIDDFGTGYSSMAYLKRLPIDKLKIDMAFTQAVPGDGEAIATAILAMAHTLGLSVVAEGVETPAQREFFRQAGCQQLQGYLIGRAVPADEFAARWLAAANVAQGAVCVAG
ncbi:EAL domain-containing protein [uncultured Pseudoxanthomonas sp.]|uniref:putative bifunctional diguanylate cyclase/phosphodiesterase n=1 Tax=uncultured Pseudoxanthomonas sp. TaxID=281701 RepID=UPI00261468A3|nr:EAL domain-containing protein [uncultured Pseudoxanthomonas sp.]